MADKLRVAVLGMAHDHVWTNLKELAELDDAELVAGADENTDLRNQFTEKTGCKAVYDNYVALLDAEKPDAVFCFTATAHHANVVELCAPRGIHVMVEKPMGATLEQADRMLTAVRKAKTTLMVNWPTAWNRGLRTAYRLVNEGAVGQMWQLLWRGGHSGPDELGCSEHFCGFLFDKHLNGAGAFNDYGGYGASMCVLFLGSPNEVVGVAGRLLKTHLPVDDNGMMILRYPQAMCRLEMTWTEAVPHKPPHDVTIYGTEGTIIAGGNTVTLYTRENEAGEDVPVDALPEGQNNGPEHFIACIRDGREPEFLTNVDLSRNAQEVMEAGLISATSGATVSLPVEDHLFRE
ncbi:MAG: Gfo/Idh/MocA family oxidoreductase [Candidatus Latescibacteria bacterium]|jgi:predicted dehydrogenase|nr:Gfo/Idh/MocA family oxidoreductase [Candidatus Latescibacterota bacterium]